ncbi:MAG: PAS domain S-box protein [Anaerolineae bacterium]
MTSNPPIDDDKTTSRSTLPEDLSGSTDPRSPVAEDGQEYVTLLRRRLDDAESRYAALLENLSEVAFTLGSDGSLTHLAGNCIGITGYTDQELLALPIEQLSRRLFAADDEALLYAELEKARSSGGWSTLSPLSLTDKAGEVRSVQICLCPLSESPGLEGTVHGIMRDVSDHVRAQRTMASLNAAAEAVQCEAIRPEGVFRAVTEQLSSLDLASAILLMDERAARLHPASASCPPRLVLSLEPLLGSLTHALAVDIEDISVIAHAIRARETVHFRWTEALLVQALPGYPRAILSRVAQLVASFGVVIAPLVADGAVLGILAVTGEHLTPDSVSAMAAFANQTAIAIRNADLVKRQRESEAEYRGIFEASIDGLLVSDPSGRIVSANPAVCEMYGYTHDELVGLSAQEIVDPEHLSDLRQFMQEVQNGGRYHAESVGRRQDGTTFPVEVIGAPMAYPGTVRYLAIVRDITTRISAQDALVRAERLHALGQMASGIAHDFNNILVAVRGYADLALQDLVSAPDRVREDVLQVLTAAKHAAETVRRLQALSRQNEDTSDFAVLQIDDVVREAIELCRPRWKDQAQGSGVTVRVHTSLSAPAPIRGNAGELRRVFTNLIVNALDAMSAGGDLHIETRCSGQWTMASVRDSGMGIPLALHTRIFEPFYSTKPGTGSGLGLTISQSVLRRHGGEIAVSSEIGQGATFLVRLPVANAAIPSPPPLAAEPVHSDWTRQSILVVDDEPAVRGLLQRVLSNQGHEVTSVDGGSEALLVLQERAFDVLITDLGMPDVSGHQVVRRARELYPQMPIVLSTGWGDTISPDTLHTMGANALLTKPFTLSELADVLGKVIAMCE